MNKLNLLTLDKRNNLWNDLKPIAHGKTVEQCALHLQKFGAERVEVRFQSIDTKYNLSDIKKFSKRLRAICEQSGYRIIHEWENRVVDGYIFPTQFVTTIER